MEENQTRIETSVYLEKITDKGPVKVNFRMSGGLEVLDDIDAVIQSKIENGYQPEAGRPGGAGPAASGNGGQGSSSRTEKFQHQGQTWYVNQSKEPGKFYVARKDKSTGKYVYLKDIPDFIKTEYGNTLS